jgi:hypothetical protein
VLSALTRAELHLTVTIHGKLMEEEGEEQQTMRKTRKECVH